MAEWRQFDPANYFPIIGEVENALNQFDTVVDALSIALGVLEDVCRFIAAFAQGMNDVNAAIVQALRDLINSIFQAMTQTGVYWLFHVSPSPSYNLTPAQWLSQVGQSLFDRMDARRPILVDPNAFVGAAVIMGTGENLNDLLSRFYNLMKLLQNLLGALGPSGNFEPFGTEFETVPGIGRAPNWNSKKIVDIIPGLSDIAEKMLGFANSILGPLSPGDNYNGFADLLAEKVAYLVGFVQSIQDVLNLIAAILSFEGGFVLPIYGQGDADWVSEQLTTSIGGPLDVEGANYTVGAMFLAVGGTTQPADTLFDLIGLPKELTS